MVTPSPSLTAAYPLPILLVFIPVVTAQDVDLAGLLEMVRSGVDSRIRVMQVNEATHPEVVQSFSFRSLPALALVREGEELWQHTGPLNSPDMIRQLQNQIQQALHKKP